MEDVFCFCFFLNHTKTPILRCLKVYSYFRVRCETDICSLIFALRDFCTFKKLSPSVCTFNWTFTSGKISVIICLQENNFFLFLGNLNYFHLPAKYLFPLPRSLFPLLGNLNCYLLPGIIPFSTSGELISTSWEISIITFYQVNTIFHFRGTHFHFRGNLNYYLLPGKYNFPLPGNSFPLPVKSQLLPSTSLIPFFYFWGIRFHFLGNLN